MNFIIEYWYCILGILALVIFAGFFVLSQANRVKEWLKYAVTVAEAKLGEKTGQLKLRQVYDAFLHKFPIIASVMSFDTFSKLVDKALDWMKMELETNPSFNLIVKGAVENGNG